MTTDVTTDAPDPVDASSRLERFLEAAAQANVDVERLGREASHLLRLACQRAPYLATLLIRRPERLVHVVESPYLTREKPAAVMAAELAEALRGCPGDEDDEFHRILRVYRGDEFVRLGVRELELGNRSEVGRELAHLADVCMDVAIAYYDAQLRARYGAPRYTDDNGTERDAELVVIGMGKLGGEELNFASDVDLIYIYSSDAGSAGDLSLHEYFTKLCRRLNAAIGEVTNEDVVFRVDLRLRPEGSQGPLANSLVSTERYYESWGRPWERQAWLKARPSAGSAALGAEVMSVLRPFIYPRHTSPTIIDEVNELNRRIKVELDSAGVDSGFDLKNGVGGIREIEFFVQALQLIYSGHQPGVRSRTTLTALDQLLFAGLITETEHRSLAEAYRYLRHAEHMIQLDSARQTQRIPASEHALEIFARRLGHRDAADFLATLRAHTAEVARLFATLGEAEDGPSSDIVALLSGQLDAAGEQAILAKLGFRDPAHAHHELDVARRKPLSPLGTKASGAAARVAPGLLAEMVTSPDPDQALMYMSDLISRRGAWSPIWRLFDDQPALMRLLVSLFGTSSYLAKVFVNSPNLIDVLVDIGRNPPPRAKAQLRAELDRVWRDAAQGDDEEVWNLLAGFKSAQILRIGLADIGGVLGPEAVSQELSHVADVCLERAYERVRESMVPRHGQPIESETGQPATLAVLALGKLGGEELGYASDLDIVFVYSADGESNGPRPIDTVTYMTRLAQRLMSSLHAMHPGGRLYELDTRLRPAGSQGLLVSSLSAWQRYHRGEARLWERQALTKLRPVAGDPVLGQTVAEAAQAYVYGAKPGEDGRETVAELAQGITAMRDKIERELAGPSAEYDLKAGRGGLIDIEFASQYLQLAYGPSYPALRSRSTVACLVKAAELGLADAEDCALLADGYRFLRGIEHRMRIVHDRSVHRLPRDGVELEKLARRAGYADGKSLIAAYERWTYHVRDAYQRVVRVS